MAGMQLLAQTARVSGLDAAMSAALRPWRKPRAVHDPGKIIVDVAMALAAGGDCPADVAVVRAGSALFGPAASDPTISRLLAWMQLLALDGEHAVAEPKRLRLRLFTICGRLIRTARRHILDANWPWTNDVLHGLHNYAPG